tara:strand:- start:27671 stop:28240 length:570 start_codon:yes stop_codon:yes gene_type:complete
MFARTPRLLLRPGWVEDAPALSNALADTAITRNLRDMPAVATPEAARAFLAAARDPLSPYFLIFARTGGAPRLVGGCSIIREGGAPELSFWIARPYWGLGFATEAASAAIRIVRAAGLGRMIARPATDNVAASHVLSKIGFRLTGRRETRRTAARDRTMTCSLFEDSCAGPMRIDPAQELYMDRSPIAA